MNTVAQYAAKIGIEESDMLEAIGTLKAAYKEVNNRDTTLTREQIAELVTQSEDDMDSEAWAEMMADAEATLASEGEEEGETTVSISADPINERERKLAAKLNTEAWGSFVDTSVQSTEHNKRAVAMAALLLGSLFSKEELADIPVFGSVAHDPKTGARSNNPDVYLAKLPGSNRKATRHRVYDIFDASEKGKRILDDIAECSDPEKTNGRSPKEIDADRKMYNGRLTVGRRNFRDGLALLRKMEQLSERLPKLGAEIAMDERGEKVRRSPNCIRVFNKANREFTEYLTTGQFLKADLDKAVAKGADMEAFTSSYGRGTKGEQPAAEEQAAGYPKGIEQAITMMQHLATFFDYESDQGRKNRAKLMALAGGKGGDTVVLAIGALQGAIDEPYSTVERRFVDLQKADAAQVKRADEANGRKAA